MSTGLTKLRRARWEHPFLPVSTADVRARGWSELDIIIVSGDAYVDHPAFGPPLIARFLEARGFKVGFLAQPDWQSAEPVRAPGRHARRAPVSRDHRVRQPRARGVSRSADHPRRHRGVAAADRALRLLVRH